MQTIAFNFRTNAIIYETFDDFWLGINQSIYFQNPTFQNLDENTLRIDATLNIPSSLKITDAHKQALTQRLAIATQKSIKLQLNLIGVSSVSITPPKSTIKDTDKDNKEKNTEIDEELLYLEESILNQFSSLFTDAELQNLSVSW